MRSLSWTSANFILPLKNFYPFKKSEWIRKVFKKEKPPKMKAFPCPFDFYLVIALSEPYG